MQMPSKQRKFVREALEIPEPQMDVIDRRIIAELQDAPRLRVEHASAPPAVGAAVTVLVRDGWIIPGGRP